MKSTIGQLFYSRKKGTYSHLGIYQKLNMSWIVTQPYWSLPQIQIRGWNATFKISINQLEGYDMIPTNLGSGLESKRFLPVPSFPWQSRPSCKLLSSTCLYITTQCALQNPNYRKKEYYSRKWKAQVQRLNVQNNIKTASRMIITWGIWSGLPPGVLIRPCWEEQQSGDL